MDRAEVFSAPAVSMQQMLLRREQRAQEQRAMLEETRCAALVSFTLNIPGPVKQSPALQRAFEAGKEQLSLLFAGHILKTHTTRAVTGSELLLALDLAPETVKSRLVQLENSHPIGRLFDMDVLDREGAPLSRTALSAPRWRCLVCGQDAKLCARSAAHSPEALQSRIASLLDGYFRDRAADQFASCACRALLYEVSVTPKPGLVDRHNAGSHTDMDFFSFLDSAAALTPHLRDMFRTGWDLARENIARLFGALRLVGLQAEDAMLRATGGVNTHRGIIFSLAVLGGAYGRASALSGGDGPALADVLSFCRALGSCALAELPSLPVSTNGERCYRAYGSDGVRGEAARGFPSVTALGLPSLRRALADGRSINDAAALALLALIGGVEDTNMIHRGGYEAARARREEARALSAAGAPIDTLDDLDRQYIAENLSPGGCADLLALSLLLHFLDLPDDTKKEA